MLLHNGSKMQLSELFWLFFSFNAWRTKSSNVESVSWSSAGIVQSNLSGAGVTGMLNLIHSPFCTAEYSSRNGCIVNVSKSCMRYTCIKYIRLRN